MGPEPHAGNRRRGTRARWLPGLLALAAGLAAAGCGNKEDPKPPPSRIPAATSDLTVQQRGDELMLRMTYPSLTIGGLPLDQIEAIEVWRLTRVLPSFLFEGGAAPASGEGQETPPETEAGEGDEAPSADTLPADIERDAAAPAEVDVEDLDEPPAAGGEAAAQEAPSRSLMFRFPAAGEETTEEQPKEALVSADPSTFAAEAELQVSLAGSELEAAVTGDKLVIRLPVGEPSEEGETAYILAVKTVAGRKLTSSFSNLVKIVPREPPPGPTAIAVVARERGIELNWETEATGKGFHVYRRLAQERGYGQPIYAAAAETQTYLDTGVTYGNRYIYTVTKLASRLPVVESAITAEFEIDYEDRFAPAPPTNPVALPEAGQVRLLWEPSPATDLAGYLVLRGLAGEEPGAIHLEPVTGLEYVDTDVVVGRSYVYRIVAVDQSANRSEPTPEVLVRVP